MEQLKSGSCHLDFGFGITPLLLQSEDKNGCCQDAPHPLELKTGQLECGVQPQLTPDCRKLVSVFADFHAGIAWENLIDIQDLSPKRFWEV